MSGNWYEIPSQRKVSRETVIKTVVASGYKAEHAETFVDACARAGALVNKNGKFYEFRKDGK
jgi:hypothetical protein